MYRTTTLLIIFLIGANSENPSDAESLLVAEQKAAEFAEKFSPLKPETVLRITVPGSQHRYQCYIETTEKQKPTRCVAYENTQEYRAFEKWSRPVMERVDVYRARLGIDLPTTVDELIALSIDNLRAKYPHKIDDHVMRDLTSFRNFLTKLRPDYKEFGEIAGVEWRGQYEITEYLLPMREEKERRAEVKHDREKLPDVYRLLDDFQLSTKRYPQLDELRDDFEKLKMILTRVEDPFHLLDNTEESRKFAAEILQNARTVWERFDELEDGDFSTSNEQKHLEIRRLIVESNLSENKKKVLLKVLDQHLEKIRVKQIDYLSEWEGKAYIENRENRLRKIESVISNILAKRDFGGQKVLMISEPLSDVTFYCYVDSNNKNRPFYCAEEALSKEYRDYEKAVDEFFAQMQSIERRLGYNLPDVAELLAVDFSLDNLRTRHPARHRSLFDELEAARAIVMGSIPEDVVLAKLPDFSGVSIVFDEYRASELDDPTKTASESGDPRYQGGASSIHVKSSASSDEAREEELDDELQSIFDLVSKLAEIGSGGFTGETRQQLIELRQLVHLTQLINSEKKKEIIGAIEERLSFVERQRMQYLTVSRGDAYVAARDNLLSAIERKVEEAIRSTPGLYLTSRSLLRVAEPMSKEFFFCRLDTSMLKPISCTELIFTQEFVDIKQALARLSEKIVESERVLGARLPTTADMVNAKDFSMKDVRKKFPVHHRRLFDELELARTSAVDKFLLFSELPNAPGLAVRIYLSPESDDPTEASSRRDHHFRDDSAGLKVGDVLQRLDETLKSKPSAGPAGEDSIDVDMIMDIMKTDDSSWAGNERATRIRWEQLKKSALMDEEELKNTEKELWRLRLMQALEIIFPRFMSKNSRRDSKSVPDFDQHPALRQSWRECKDEIKKLLLGANFFDSEVPVPQLWNDIIQTPEAKELPKMLEEFFRLYDEAKRQDREADAPGGRAEEDVAFVPIEKRIADQKFVIMRKMLTIHTPRSATVDDEDYEEFVRRNARREGIREDFVELAMLTAELEEADSDLSGSEANFAEEHRALAQRRREVIDSTIMDERRKKIELAEIDNIIREQQSQRLLELLWGRDVIGVLDEDFVDVIERDALLKVCSLEFFKLLAELEPKLSEEITKSEQPIGEFWNDFLQSEEGRELNNRREHFVKQLMGRKRLEAVDKRGDTMKTPLKQKPKSRM